MQEMQLAQLWHAVMGLFLTVVIIAHIYIGTIGMEGAFDAMGSGEVDRELGARAPRPLGAGPRAQARLAAGDD